MPATTAPPKLRVAIIGGGIAGLSAALFLRKHSQFSVTVYERRGADFKESSAAIGIRSNGIFIAKQLGISREDIRAVVEVGYRTYNIREEEVSKSRVDNGLDGESGLWSVVRQDFKDVLLRKVTSKEGEGESIQVLYGSHIINVDPEIGVVMFADGTSVEVDLIIGADGIHSKVRAAVIPFSHPEPVPCGVSIYRFVLPMDVVKDAIGSDEQMPAMYNCDEGPFTAIITDGDADNPNARKWPCHAVMYPCRNLEQMSFACVVPDSILRNPAQLEYSWNAKGNVEEMVEAFQEFPGWLIRIFSRIPKADLFQARDQEPLPTYVKGRTVLIGDAAHAMVPYQSQGANQALEDVEGLNVLLQNVLDRDSIPSLLRVWDKVRRPRASEIQRGSRSSQSQIATRNATNAIISVKPFVPMKEALAQM